MMDIFYGQMTRLSGHVYVRASDCRPADGWTISGTVRGPQSRYAATLPTTFAIADLGVGPNVLGKATVVDPCFWSRDMPAIYDVQVELKQHGETQQRADRQLGIRSLGTRGRSLLLDARRWVVRGVQATVSVGDLPHFREAFSVAVVEDPSDELCAEASAEGVMVAAEVSGTVQQVLAAVQRLARWPAVAMVIVAGARFGSSLRNAAPNLLLVQRVPNSHHPPAEWAELLYCPASEVTEMPPVPTIVWRAVEADDIATARQCCDRLQADMTRVGDFAGYVTVRCDSETL